MLKDISEMMYVLDKNVSKLLHVKDDEFLGLNYIPSELADGSSVRFISGKYKALQKLNYAYYFTKIKDHIFMETLEYSEHMNNINTIIKNAFNELKHP